MKGSPSPKKKRVSFSLEAPTAQSVLVAGSFTEWELGAIALTQQKNGLWKTTAAVKPGKHRYRFIVDGAWFDDPSCAVREMNPFGSEDCILVV